MSQMEWEQLVVDAADPAALGRWWATALGWTVVNDDPEEFEIRPAPERMPGLLFVRVPESKAVKNRLHLDILASGERTDPFETRRQRVDAEASRLASLGATITCVLQQEGLDHYAVGMKDPEGNEFDIN